MKKIALIGASGHGEVVAEIAELNSYSVVFYDDAYPDGGNLGPWEIRGSVKSLNSNLDNFESVFVSIGNNNIRERIQLDLQKKGCKIATLIHPAGVVSRYATLKPGTVVMANAVINPFASLGEGCIVNTCAVIEHDCGISDFAHISPNASLAGGVVVGTKSWVGLGTSVRQLIKIGDNTVVGAGSVVVRDLPSNVIAYGVPAVIKD
ncbi:acetyltransferase [Pseudoalteromonas sp. T1lg22]|uniref:acetyltransferase n=1 Tax=Pseudoalteromonas sp. T1lg22 TaxID=2077096 RepID=UPI000CF6700F|nr:acetyltransferase [Pseudoalteromonas sp. T1lg22]